MFLMVVNINCKSGVVGWSNLCFCLKFPAVLLVSLGKRESVGKTGVDRGRISVGKTGADRGRISHSRIP